MMTQFSDITAVFFDMDGTLIDSELLNEPVIRQFCAERGIGVPDVDWSEFYGVSWSRIAARLLGSSAPQDSADASARRLHALYTDACNKQPPPPLPGARDAVVAAHASMHTGIVSSSLREAIDDTVRRLNLVDHVKCRVGAEDYQRSKPEPDGFLHAATLLKVAPRNCLVFEDSAAGMQAARSAGMHVVAVMYRSNAAGQVGELADHAIGDFTELGDGFFERIAARRR